MIRNQTRAWQFTWLPRCMLALLVGAAGPAAAERLVFEGSFTTYHECGFADRHECTEPVTLDAPFSFTVDLPSGLVSGRTRVDTSDRYAAPFLTPALATDKIWLTAETFESLSNRRRHVETGYFSSRAGSGLRWNFSASHSLAGHFDRSGIAHGLSSMERLDLSITADTGKSASDPVTFAELVKFFDDAVASRTPIPVDASGAQESAELGNPTGASSLVTNLGGTFRVVAVQCRTPAGMLDRLHARTGG